LRNSTASSRAIPRPTPAPARPDISGRQRPFWSNPETVLSLAERRNTYVRSAPQVAQEYRHTPASPYLLCAGPS
jgi:hypothetical protein